MVSLGGFLRFTGFAMLTLMAFDPLRKKGRRGTPCYSSSHTKRAMVCIPFLGPPKGGDKISADKLDASKIGLTKTYLCMSSTSHTVTLPGTVDILSPHRP